MTAPQTDERARRTVGQTIIRVVLTIVVLLILVMWIYAFFFASKKAAYRVDDAAWRARAAELCSKYTQERLKLVDTSGGYIENPTTEQMIERADVVDRATDILERQLADVVSVQPSSVRDRDLVAKYEGYWNMVLADRRAYTATLRDLRLEPYGETKVDGGPVSNLLTDFTTVNQMQSCAPPGELGGDV